MIVTGVRAVYWLALQAFCGLGRDLSCWSPILPQLALAELTKWAGEEAQRRETAKKQAMHYATDPLAGKEAAAARRCLTVLKQVRGIGPAVGKLCSWRQPVQIMLQAGCMLTTYPLAPARIVSHMPLHTVLIVCRRWTRRPSCPPAPPPPPAAAAVARTSSRPTWWTRWLR